MLSVMTVEIITIAQTLTSNGVALSSGTLEFSNYSRDGVATTSLSYEAYGATAVALMSAGSSSKGIAVGYVDVDVVNKSPIFKIQSFAPTSLPSVKLEEEPAEIPFG